MGSSSKRQTTMAKIAREHAVRERRLRKQAKKDARKQAAAGQEGAPSETPSGEDRLTEPPSTSTEPAAAIWADGGSTGRART